MVADREDMRKNVGGVQEGLRGRGPSAASEDFREFQLQLIPLR